MPPSHRNQTQDSSTNNDNNLISPIQNRKLQQFHNRYAHSIDDTTTFTSEQHQNMGEIKNCNKGDEHLKNLICNNVAGLGIMAGKSESILNWAEQKQVKVLYIKRPMLHFDTQGYTRF